MSKMIAERDVLSSQQKNNVNSAVFFDSGHRLRHYNITFHKALLCGWSCGCVDVGRGVDVDERYGESPHRSQHASAVSNLFALPPQPP